LIIPLFVRVSNVPVVW